MKPMFDTNVLLDVLLDRKPYSSASSQALGLAERGAVHGAVCATSITTIYYLCAKACGREQADGAIKDIMSILEVAPVNRAVLEEAIEAGFPDFEDGVVMAAARACEATHIITRDTRGFVRSDLPTLLPEEFIQAMSAL